MAVETWGIDQEVVDTSFDQIQVTDAGPVTPDRVESLVKQSAAQVNGITKAIGFDVATLASDTESDEYHNIRRLVLKVLAPDLHLLAFGATQADHIQDLRDERDRCLKEYRRTPTSVAGTDDDSYAPQVRGSVSYNQLAVDDDSRRKRTQFNRLVARDNGLPDDKFYH